MIRYHFRRDYIVYSLVVLAIIFGIFIGYYMFSEDTSEEMIQKVIQLRSNQQNVLVKSRLINDIDSWVYENANRNIEAEWADLHPCLKDGCKDSKFLAFISVIAKNEHPKHYGLISNLVTAYAVWGSEEAIVDFSRAVAMTNDDVEDIGSRRLEASWEKILECNNLCDERDDLFFYTINEILNQ